MTRCNSRLRALPSSVVLIAVAALGLLRPSPAGAQSATVAALKAAFLYNFARFAEWPPEAVRAGQKLVLCVANDPRVAGALKNTVNGRVIDGHELTVTSIALNDPLESCHLAYLAGIDRNEMRRLIASLRGAPILSVGDADNFAESGGVAQFFVEGDRMRFAINLKSADRARLRLSSKLLALARITKDNHDRH